MRICNQGRRSSKQVSEAIDCAGRMAAALANEVCGGRGFCLLTCVRGGGGGGWGEVGRGCLRTMS